MAAVQGDCRFRESSAGRCNHRARLRPHAVDPPDARGRDHGRLGRAGQRGGCRRPGGRRWDGRSPPRAEVAALASLGFDGNPGQTHLVLGAGGPLQVAVGVGDPASIDAAGTGTRPPRSRRDAAGNAGSRT